jgi:hypothetical protein
MLKYKRRKFDEFIFEMLKRIAEKFPQIKKEFRQLVKEKILRKCLSKISYETYFRYSLIVIRLGSYLVRRRLT